MADFEDANSPTWANQVEGHVNLIDAIEGTITYDSSEGKHYELDDEVATLLVRPRGWHLPEKHLKVDGETLAGAFMDFGLYVFHNAQRLLDKGTAPYFYLPKMEHHLEARLWNDVFVFAQDALGIPQGTIRATVLIETLPAAFQMDEILYELRDHSYGLNAGRWDYIFSMIKCFRDRPGVRAARPHGREDDRAVHARLHRAARPDLPQARRVRDGRHGGADPLAQGQGGQRGGARRRQGRQGARGQGRLRRHLGRAPGRRLDREGRLRRGAGRQAQPDRQAAPRRRASTPEQLLDAESTPGEITEEGLRNDVSVGFQYISFWLGGRGAAGINNLMEDAATAEISRSQIWQWVKHGKFTREHVREVLDEEMEKIRAEVGEETWQKGRPDETREIFERVSLGDEFPDFLTLPAYDYLDSSPVRWTTSSLMPSGS